MEYLVHACNEIHDTLLSTLEPTPEQLTKVFTIACNTLKQLRTDSDFLHALDELMRRRASASHPFAEITKLEHFVHGFLVIERKVLKAAGLDEQSIDHLLEKATSLLDKIRQPAPTKEEVLAEIISTQGEVCLTASTLHDRQQVAKDAQQHKKRLQRAAFTIGGGVMIFADASSLAVSVGLSAAGSAVSGAAGAALITYGITPSE